MRASNKKKWPWKKTLKSLKYKKDIEEGNSKWVQCLECLGKIAINVRLNYMTTLGQYIIGCKCCQMLPSLSGKCYKH